MQENTTTKEQLHEWFKENRTNRIITVLGYGVKQIDDKDLATAILLQSTQWNEFKKMEAKGILNKDESWAKRNQFHANLLHWINQLPDEVSFNTPKELLEKADDEDRLINKSGGIDWKKHKRSIAIVLSIVAIAVTLMSYFYILPRFYLDKATTFWSTDNFDKSIEYCNKAIEISPSWWKPYNLKACNFIYLNKMDEATIEANKALNLDINNAFPYTTLAQIFALKGDDEKFYYYLEKALILKFDAEIHKNEIGFLQHKNENRFLTLLSKYAHSSK